MFSEMEMIYELVWLLLSNKMMIQLYLVQYVIIDYFDDDDDDDDDDGDDHLTILIQYVDIVLEE